MSDWKALYEAEVSAREAAEQRAWEAEENDAALSERAEAAEADNRRLRDALTDFLYPWAPEHYPQLRAALAAAAAATEEPSRG